MSANLEIFDLVLHADMITKSILAILTIASIFSWTIVFEKIFKLRLLKVKSAKFYKLFWSGQTLEEIHRQTKNATKHPMAAVFSAAMQEWESNDIVGIARGSDIAKKTSLKERLVTVMDIALNKSMSKLRYGLNFLLIVANTSTLFSLFGTVYGVMTTFQSITAMKDTSLITVAPGISGALITTVFGLFAAIPATIFYYVYAAKLSSVEDELYNFTGDMFVILTRELER